MSGPDSPAAALAVPSPDPGSAALLDVLAGWSEIGWIRRLDLAFARFVVKLSPAAPPPLVLAAALTAALEAQGHTSLALERLLGEPDELLDFGSAGSPPRALSPGSAPVAPFAAVWGAMPQRLDEWLTLLRSSPLVACDGDAARAPGGEGPPLVLDRGRLYLRRYWRCERQVAAAVREREQASATAPAIDTGLARAWLDRLFPPARVAVEADADQDADASADAGAGGVDWQRVACALALRGRLTVITGGPGTGKTHTAARLLALLFATDPAPERLRVALAAPTGKAAARLRRSIGESLGSLHAQLADVWPDPPAPTLESLVARIGAARTLHALLGARPGTRRFGFDAAHPLPLDLLIVDEASMIHLEMMAALLAALPRAARLILLGDKDQLASVEPGAVLGELCRDAETGRYRPETVAFVQAVTGQTLPPAMQAAGPALAQQTVMLRRSHRFGGPIGRLAAAVNAGDLRLAQSLLEAGPAGEGAAGPGGAIEWMDAATPAEVVNLAILGRRAGGRASGGHPGGHSFDPSIGPAIGAGESRACDTEFGGYAGAGGYLDVLRRRPVPGPQAQGRAAFDAWVLAVLAAFERFRLLCAQREGAFGAAGLNAAIERGLLARGVIPRGGEWYEGRPVLVTRNDPDAGVFNGDVGIVLRPWTPAARLPTKTRLQAALPAQAPTSALRAHFPDGDGVRAIAVSRLVQVETAYAMTVHKAQGSEFAHTVLVLPPQPSRVLTRELVYTGITRAREALTLVTGRREALAEALARRTRREGPGM